MQSMKDLQGGIVAFGEEVAGLSGEVVSERLGKELQFLAEPSWEKRVLGVLLYCSWARGDAAPDSDIDLCL
ncbi:nucleotidyltransferase domain-containing protein, partial [Methanothrix sp.]|uniref:nucleotidyltransferase domain-containing protein n=1 Tax=Methanothrix sp. TaxID=90426 RepID=UPI0023532FD5